MSRFIDAVSVILCVVGLIVSIFAFSLTFLALYDSLAGSDGLRNAWGESAEFSQLMGGQERFSEHATNVDGITVVVDHETGVQYLADGHGMTALLDVDGTPLRVKEAA